MTTPIELKGGLDLRRAKVMVEPGRLLDGINYETTTDVHGYKPTDGFERFDGRMSPSTTDVWQLTVPTASITGTFTAGESMSWTLGAESGDLGSVAVYATVTTNKVITFAYWLSTDYLPDGATVTGDDSGATFIYDLASHTLEHVTTYAGTVSALFTELDAYADAVRPNIGTVPGNGPVLGIKRFEASTYAIRNFFSIGFDGGGVEEPAVYQRVRDASGNEGIIMDFDHASGDWGAGTAAGMITIDAYLAGFAVADNDQLDLLGEAHFSSGSEEPSVGDVLSGQTSGNTVTVHRIRLDSGSWLGGSATGVIFFYSSSGLLTDGELIDNDNTTTTDVLTHTETTHLDNDDFIDATAVTANQSGAAMWKSSRTGWVRNDLGWELRYDTGTNEPPIINLGGSAEDLATDAEDTGWLTGLTVSEAAPGPTHNSWSNLTPTRLASDDGSEASVSMPSYNNSADAYVSNFPVTLESSDTPLGFELEFRVFRSSGTNDAKFTNMRLAYGASQAFPDTWTINKYDSTNHINTGTEYTHEVGGAADDWGGWVSGGGITADEVNDANFGVRFRITRGSTGGTDVYNVDRVRLKITYLPAGAEVFFWDGAADRGSGILTQDYILSGSYVGNDAAGTLSLASITRYDFGAGIEIRTAEAGGGTLISVTTGGPTRVTMAGSTLLEAEVSLYQMIDYNFFAADSLNALWGVSGAALAFVWDGLFFRQIRTGVLEVNDKPRHLGSFQFRLILGYSWGEESWSVAASPLTFDGTLNAVATGYGFPITGIKELPGQVLGTFTTGGVFGTKVSGADFSQQILAPGSNVIEYSVQEFGNDVLWCDQNGVRNLESSDKYGDFVDGTLSRDVNKWLRPRLQRQARISPRNGNFVNSTVIRSKGQYRMFFADGQVLTMTWNQVDPPEFTRQKLWLDDDETNAYVKVFATSSDIDETGPEHVYFSVAERTDYDHSTDLGYVFNSDRGITFDGDAITAFMSLSWINAGNAVINKRFTSWQLHGESYGYATPTIDFAVDLVEPDGAGSETVKIGASGSPAIILETVPFFAKPRSKKRGRNVSIRFDHNSSTELPHLLQLLVSVDESAGRKEK